MKLTPDLIGKTVKVWLNHSGASAQPFVEGKVIGYCDHPTLIIQDANGRQSTHSSQLRIEVVDPLPPEPMEIGSMVLDKDGDFWQRVKIDFEDQEFWRHDRLNRDWANLNRDYGPLTRIARVAWDYAVTEVTP